ncbi:hypothetical protein PInf_013743 [Phytophthora infestans]|nr:hypothetical protein PInf_013743 [Phytophthora infestans]
METLESPPSKRQKKEEMLKDMMLELKEKELQDQKDARELEAAHREADRAPMLALVQFVSSSIAELIKNSKNE